jgi:hypothetical protein
MNAKLFQSKEGNLREYLALSFAAIKKNWPDNAYDGGRLEVLEEVALVSDNADLIPDGPKSFRYGK